MPAPMIAIRRRGSIGLVNRATAMPRTPHMGTSVAVKTHPRMGIVTRAPARTISLTLSLRSLLAVIPAATVALAFVIRGRRAFALVDFPLNDGGMFYATIEDLRHAGYVLPHTLSYNFANIPFAY